jgi:hypothetical protein
MLRNLIAAAALMVSVTGCSLFSGPAAPEDLDKVGTLFFERLKGAEYDTIFGDGAAELKKNKTRSEVVSNLTQLMSNGKLMVYARLSTYFTEHEKTRIAVTTYSAVFEKGKGEVLLYFADERGEWKLGGFEYKTKA